MANAFIKHVTNSMAMARVVIIVLCCGACKRLVAKPISWRGGDG